MELPQYLENTISQLERFGHEAWIVGGCVRDLLLDKKPNDWDITTSATPEEMLKVFPGAHYENVFGTVILPIKTEAGENVDAIEITTFRSEQGYSDRRRPDKVEFEKDVEADLARRDFTINALAMKKADSSLLPKDDLRKFVVKKNGWLILDLFGGIKDLDKRIVRAVGEPMDRFKEDSLRMMRAIRFACQLGFKIEEKTERSILKMAGALKFIARERVAVELIKILKSDRPYDGIIALHETKLLQYIIPEMEAGVGMDQNHHHIFTVFEHGVLSLKNCPSKDWRVRFAALIHDIGKPKVKKIIGGAATFYNHEYVGAKLAHKICRILKFSAEDTEKIYLLVRNHMFYYNVGEVTAASVRRLIKKVGEENLEDLIAMRVGDRLGSGTKKAMPYKLRHLQYMFERVRKDPVSVKMLAVNGSDLMEKLKIAPSPKIGEILDVLLSEVIEDPALNDKEALLLRAEELNRMDGAELRKRAKAIIEDEREKEDRNMKKGFHV